MLSIENLPTSKTTPLVDEWRGGRAAAPSAPQRDERRFLVKVAYAPARTGMGARHRLAPSALP
eukprot:scaffold209848_cov41-Tisochrysis_lutea.AAC.1